MVKGITLKINNTVLSNRIAEYSVDREISFKKVVANLNGKERAYGKTENAVVSFRLFARSASQIKSDYDILKNGIMTVVFTDPDTNTDKTLSMRLNSRLPQTYGLLSYDGNVYYTSEMIILRETAVS